MLNYTTTIKSEKTVGEIQAILSQNGVSKIVCDYSKGMCVGISFMIVSNGTPIYFNMPANFAGVKKAIMRKTRATKYHTDIHAVNVCWRIIKDWIEAQLALIQAEQADIATVFMPYAIMNNGKSISHNFLKTPQGSQLLLKQP